MLNWLVGAFYFYTIWTLFTVVGWVGALVGFVPGVGEMFAAGATWKASGRPMSQYNILLLCLSLVWAVQRVWFALAMKRIDRMEADGKFDNIDPG